jgi:hypothetical protein
LRGVSVEQGDRQSDVEGRRIWRKEGWEAGRRKGKDKTNGRSAGRQKLATSRSKLVESDEGEDEEVDAVYEQARAVVGARSASLRRSRREKNEDEL